ncbi:MAG: hypothetical protein IJF07_01325, partial [Lachnospiraceae bacterium]|nr:hypothetical protein [Lachnospiraceae bacterium]
LVYFPILLVSVLEYYIFSLQNPNFFCIKFQSALLGMIATIVLFYTYQGVLGRNVDWINIAIYFLAMAIAYKYSYQTLNQKKAPMNNSTLCILLGSLLIILFMIFTVYPPDIGLFATP